MNVQDFEVGKVKLILLLIVAVLFLLLSIPEIINWIKINSIR